MYTITIKGETEVIESRTGLIRRLANIFIKDIDNIFESEDDCYARAEQFAESIDLHNGKPFDCVLEGHWARIVRTQND